ncbi:MAG: hypothetical protein DBY24_07375 [Prevotellaceae bacterium]|nr:MAG: hypothetical protein DBY24_07375 [Prevotellaceae bacterium]
MMFLLTLVMSLPDRRCGSCGVTCHVGRKLPAVEKRGCLHVHLIVHMSKNACSNLCFMPHPKRFGILKNAAL